MTAPASLLEIIMNLLRDPSAQAAFQADPGGWLASCGAGSVTPEQIHDALTLVNERADGPGHHVPPPPAPHPGEGSHEVAIRYLNTYVENTYVDDRDTTIDSSLHQHIDTGGGDFDQDIDSHAVYATGDGAVAAGGDIEDSTVVTGNDNLVGSGNIRGNNNVQGDDNQVVSGTGNTAGFGSGDVASSHVGGSVSVGAGGAFNTGGTTNVNNANSSTNNSGNTTTETDLENVGNTTTDNSIHDSGNTTTETHTETDTHLEDVGNTTTTQTDSSEHVIDHSFNVT